MKLNRHDMVQFEGLLARNPVTDQPTGFLQYYTVTRDCDGDTIDPRSLYPLPRDLGTPIALSRVVSRNMRLSDEGGAVSERCRCVSCSYCHGSGTMRVPDRLSPDGSELEQCDECNGCGISEECDHCRESREMEEDGF